MKKLKLVIIGLVIANSAAMAQLSVNGHFYGVDALKFYTNTPNGTAKTMGMGGSFTALGADASSAYLNPAGLGFYNKSEFSITPYFGNSNNTASYIGSTQKTSSSDAKLGQLAVVFSSKASGSRKRRSAWSVGYNTLANFQSEFNVSGANNKSSLSDYFAERANQRNISSTDLDKEFDSNSGLADNATALAYQGYLIDPFDNNKYGAAELSIPVNQQINVRNTGTLGQVNLSYGVNYDNKTYIGFGLGIQNLNQSTFTTISEKFPNGKVIKGFDFSDELYVSGSGLNLNLGVILKLTESIRFGMNVVSPTAMRVDETYIANLSNLSPKVPNFETLETVPNDFNYKITSPLKASAGFSFFLPKKIGVLNVDADYIGYSRMNVKDNQDARWSADQKSGIQGEFKDILNIKAGLELRYKIARFRAGAAVVGNPLKNDQVNAKYRTITSLGAGIRNNKLFADLAFSGSALKSAFTPYTLANAQDYASVLSTTQNNTVAITIGTYF